MSDARFWNLQSASEGLVGVGLALRLHAHDQTNRLPAYHRFTHSHPSHPGIHPPSLGPEVRQPRTWCVGNSDAPKAETCIGLRRTQRGLEEAQVPNRRVPEYTTASLPSCAFCATPYPHYTSISFLAGREDFKPAGPVGDDEARTGPDGEREPGASAPGCHNVPRPNNRSRPKSEARLDERGCCIADGVQRP